LSLLACSNNPTLIIEEASARPKIQFDKETFDRERAAWEAQGITNYTFVGIFNWLDMIRSVITVENGEISYIENKTAIPDTGWRTISEIYEWINDRYEYALSTIETMTDDLYYYINVGYNSQYHYPEFASMGVRSYDFALEGYFPSYIVLDFQPEE
jgi:hypothetical protein